VGGTGQGGPMKIGAGENSATQPDGRMTMLPYATERSGKWLGRLVLIAFVLTALGLALNFLPFSSQRASRNDKATALIAGGAVPVTIGDTTITSTNALYASDTKLETAVEQCGTEDQEYVPHASNRLTRDILVLQVTGYGTACVPDKTARRFGSVTIEARKLAVTVDDLPGKTLKHSDGSIYYFREIGIWVDPNTLESVLYRIPDALLGAALAIWITCLVEWVRLTVRGARQSDPTTSGMRDGNGHKHQP
jgi:uncharacterized membrane protein